MLERGHTPTRFALPSADGGLCAQAGGNATPSCDTAPFSTYPYCNPTLPVAARVADLVGRMTLAEQVGALDSSVPALPRPAPEEDILLLRLPKFLGTAARAYEPSAYGEQQEREEGNDQSFIRHMVGKDGSRAKAIQMWPERVSEFKRVKGLKVEDWV